ncbi:MAG: alpha/beta hydrolase, partial [Deltaproteobacteria bacterium]|nr:alpha/beta hydrolase [Deltaproteobacteria bacterium]
PSTIHPRTHFCKESIGNAIEWMQATLKGGKDIPLSDQTWYWKEIGTFIAMIGMILMLFPLGNYLLGTAFFKELNEAPAERKALSGWGWGVGAVITILLPIPLYLWAWSFNAQGIAKASYLFPQQITTTVMFWALSVGVISLILFLLWHFLGNRKNKATMANYGLSWKSGGMKWGRVAKSLLLAFVVIFIAHLTLVISDWLFLTDYRLWVFGIKPLDEPHFAMALNYVIPFAVYFLIAGYVLFLILQYAPLFAGGTLAIPEGHLLGIVLFQFLPIFTIVALVSTYFFRKTGHIYVGSFINAMLVTWIVVAGQATHFAF